VRAEVFCARDARFGSDDLDDCRSFGLDASMFMEDEPMKNRESRSRAQWGGRRHATSANVLSAPRRAATDASVTCGDAVAMLESHHAQGLTTFPLT
jgi:hypothetical protein